MAGKQMAKKKAGSGHQSAQAESLDAGVPEPQASAAAPSPLVLPADCRIAGQRSLKDELTARLGASAIEFDGRHVDRIDTAALQLLMLFRRDFVKHGGVISWLGASEALNEAANLLGLAQTLELPAVAPA
jgi:phospholipid transport system transporter-binding protein